MGRCRNEVRCNSVFPWAVAEPRFVAVRSSQGPLPKRDSLQFDLPMGVSGHSGGGGFGLVALSRCILKLKGSEGHNMQRMVAMRPFGYPQAQGSEAHAAWLTCRRYGAPDSYAGQYRYAAGGGSTTFLMASHYSGSGSYADAPAYAYGMMDGGSCGWVDWAALRELRNLAMGARNGRLG